MADGEFVCCCSLQEGWNVLLVVGVDGTITEKVSHSFTVQKYGLRCCRCTSRM